MLFVSGGFFLIFFPDCGIYVHTLKGGWCYVQCSGVDQEVYARTSDHVYDKKREVWVISVPVLLLVVGLWFGTPVYSCFRYVYPLFISFPLILSTAMYFRTETE